MLVLTAVLVPVAIELAPVPAIVSSSHVSEILSPVVVLVLVDVVYLQSFPLTHDEMVEELAITNSVEVAEVVDVESLIEEVSVFRIYYHCDVASKGYGRHLPFVVYKMSENC